MLTGPVRPSKGPEVKAKAWSVAMLGSVIVVASACCERIKAVENGSVTVVFGCAGRAAQGTQ
jgi:hypothetical protein